MTAGAPRNARYMDASSRETAEDLARRSGMTLNEWVSRLMAEGPEDATSQDYFNQSQANYVAQPRDAGTPRYIAAARKWAIPILLADVGLISSGGMAGLRRRGRRAEERATEPRRAA